MIITAGTGAHGMLHTTAHHAHQKHALTIETHRRCSPVRSRRLILRTRSRSLHKTTKTCVKRKLRIRESKKNHIREREKEKRNKETERFRIFNLQDKGNKTD